MDEIKIPPVSTLIGSTIGNFFKILSQGRIEPKSYFKIFITALVVLIATPFHIWERIYFKKKLKNFEFKKPPLFILGHWRSGTTLLHNMLTKDPSAGYMSTYQSLFPNNLTSKWLFRTFMKTYMPRKRWSDGVAMNVDYPQEDEFAFSNCQWNAYYNFFYFPEKYAEFYEKSVYHKNLSPKEIDLWYKSYDTLVKKALINTKGERAIFKNPVNTARIDKIQKLYPGAKFLYIHRNPYTVFFSTRRFLQHLYPTLWFHKVDNQFIDTMIFDVYTRLLEDYLKYRDLIPPENLMELKFDDFEKNPVKESEKIYSRLLNDDFSKVRNYFKTYFDTQKGHKKNKYIVDAADIDLINKHWGKYIEMFNYELPDDITLKRKL